MAQLTQQQLLTQLNQIDEWLHAIREQLSKHRIPMPDRRIELPRWPGKVLSDLHRSDLYGDIR